MNEYVEKRSLEITYYDKIIELLEIDEGYRHSFQKSLSNVNNGSDILPLIIDNKFHIKCECTESSDTITLDYKVDSILKKFDEVNQYKRHDKLRVLRNVGLIFEGLNNGYTYIISPNNLLIDDNKLVKVLYVGFNDTLEPLTQTQDEVVKQYKCLITSVLEKHEFEYLYNGGLEIVRKTQFLEKVFNATTIAEIVKMLEESLQKEEEIFTRDNKVVHKAKYNFFRISSLISIIGLIICAALAVYFTLIVVPNKDLLNDASTYFVSKDYGKVINTLKNEQIEDLPAAQTYMLAHSYIQLEPLSDENKESALKSISVKSDRRYLNYWIYLGMEDYETAINISKELTDIQLQYNATYRAIDIIKRSTSLDGTTKESLLTQYETSLENLYEQLFPEEELEDSNDE